MSELRVWEIINPSDKVTVRATIEDAAVFGAMLQRSWLFLKPADGGEPYPDIDADKEREVILSDPERLTRYITVFRSAIVGNREDYEAAIAHMTPDAAAAFTKDWQDRKRSSMNDICGTLHEVANRMEKRGVAKPTPAKEDA